MVLTSGVINDLYDEGLISSDEKAKLKAITIDKDGNVKTKISGRGKKATLKKVSIPKSKKIQIKSMRSLLAKNAKIKTKTKKYKFIRSF